MANDGSYQRKESAWRNWVDSSDPTAKFQPEKDRYMIYAAYACPWAHRTLMVRALKGLQDVISVSYVMPIFQKTKPDDPNDTHYGWMFADPEGEPQPNAIGLGGPFPASYPENDPDPIFNAKSVREIYEHVGDTVEKYTVPILFDKKLKTIVSNESSEIIQMLNSEFNDLASNPALDLAPNDLENAMKEVDEWIYPHINNGVYMCGFAKSQAAYDSAITKLTESFDKLEDTLSKRRYIAGDQFTLRHSTLYDIGSI
jgi:putative glutathione S-transferase